MKNVLWVLVLCLCGNALGQEVRPAAQAAVSYHFSWPARDASVYSFELLTDGSGSFTASLVKGKMIDAFTVPLVVSAATVSRVFDDTHELQQFNVPCAAKMKGIADTGTKVLRYKGPEGLGSCTYNNTENKTVQALTETFQGMAFSLIQARKLEFDHRFDRLSLFADMDALVNEAKSGRALEMGNIAGTLRSIADDPEVLEKVRDEAATLLKSGK